MHGPPLFCCPRCQGPLSPQPETWSCADCASDYPLRHGFIDFRTGKAIDVDSQADSKLAELLASREASCTFAELRAYYYSLKPEASDELHRRHESHFQAEAVRAKRVVQQLSEGPLLDLGCGAGQYLLAAARSGIETVGADASLCQLILARRLLADHGFNGQFALANVEQLPFPSRTFRSAVATDVLEHLHDPNLFLAETARVLAPQGALWLTTPNRFSLTPEPHVGLWGAGWLPHSLAVSYVRVRTGVDYHSIRLMSLRDLRLMLERSFPTGVQIRLPLPSPQELQAFSPAKRLLANSYLALSKVSSLRFTLLRVAPYFEATCRK